MCGSTRFRTFQEAEKGGDPRQQRGGEALKNAASVPPDGVTGAVAAPAGGSPGRSPSDYDERRCPIAVVLVIAASVLLLKKEDAAAQRGAVALIIADNIDERGVGALRGLYRRQDPGGGKCRKSVSSQLRGRSGPTTVKLTAT